MKVKEGFLVREVSGQTVIIPDGEKNVDFKGMIKLNESAKLIWEALAKGKDEEAVADELAEKYGLSKEKALSDVQSFTDRMRKEGFLEE